MLIRFLASASASFRDPLKFTTLGLPPTLSEDEAVAEGIDLLEEEARRRAVDGVNKRPIYHRGVQVGEIAQYSDKLLIFLLERRRPE